MDLSVLVWILAFAGILWSLAARTGYYKLNQLIFLSIALATVMIAGSGFLPDAKPLMSNYIPVLEHPLFLAGLALFALGIGAQVITAMTVMPPVGKNISAGGVIRFGLIVRLSQYSWQFCHSSGPGYRYRLNWPAKFTMNCCSGAAGTCCNTPSPC